MSTKPTVAIIGCGKQAPKHVSGFKAANENVDLVLVDIDENNAKQMGDELSLPWSTDLDTVLSDPNVTALDICTPTASHLPLILKTLEAQKDFFCEKPLCDTVEEAQKIAGALQDTNNIGMIGYVYRFNPVFQNIKNALSEKALGDVVTAQFRIGGRGSHQVWKHRKETNGGALSEMMVHMLDLAIWYFGPVASVEVLVDELKRPQRLIQGIVEDVDAEDLLLVRAKMKSGADVLLQADMLTPAFSQLVEIQGENGSAFGSIQPDRPSYLFLDQPISNYDKGRTDIAVENTNLFHAQMGTFLDAITTRSEPAVCTVADSLHVMQAVDMIRTQMK